MLKNSILTFYDWIHTSSRLSQLTLSKMLAERKRCLFPGNILILLPLTLLLLASCIPVAEQQALSDKYWYQAKELSKQGRYLEAAQMFEKTAAAEQASPKPILSGVSLAYNGAGYHYEKVGSYGKALENFEQALSIDRNMGDQSGIAAQLLNIGGIYKNTGRYNQALKYYQEALDINKKTGKEDRIATSLSNIGTIYKKWGKFDKALEYYQKALDLDQKNNNHRGYATRLNNIGHVYYSQGQYDVALEHYKQARDINERLHLDDQVAINLNNIAGVYDSKGQYDLAIDFYDQALAIYNKLGMEPDVANILNNAGKVYTSWGRYDQALAKYRQALDICDKIKNPYGKAVTLHNIGNAYVSQGLPNRAIEYYLQALGINEALKNEPEIAINTAQLGQLYLLQGEPSQATEFFQNALKINKKLGAVNQVGNNYSQLGTVSHSGGRYNEALKYYDQSLKILEEIGDQPGIATVLNNIGHVYFSIEQFENAISYFRKSLAYKEKIRQTATGDIRRDYLASQLYTYQLLASSLLRQGDPAGLLEVVEQSRARLLAERIAGIDSKLKIPALKEVQEDLALDEAILLFSNIDRDNFILMAITSTDIAVTEIAKESFLARIESHYEKPVVMLLDKQRGHLVEQEPPDIINELAGKHQQMNFENAILYYRNLLVHQEPMEKTFVFGSLLHDLLLAPADEILSDKKSITIMPDGILGYLPFETLVDDSGKYLVQKYNIRYTQSLTIDRLLKKRDYSKLAGRRPLLAMGGAVYDLQEYKSETVQNKNQLAWLRNETDQMIAERNSTRSAYDTLGLTGWSNLPGTLEEVQQLSSIIKEGDILTGVEVTENTVKEYSARGQLANFKVLHFATHGLVVPQMPELSALVLSQFPEEDQGEDGYLRMGEIAELHLAADFVNLSACETGLGTIYGGEGVVGLTQSFLIAGANGLSVSLWQVSDKSTSGFMTELYKKVQDSGMDYSSALTEVKRAFINGSHGSLWQNPYYWSPFVYYGL